MKKILVTGGAGFIGSHTCVLLLEKGYEVIVFDSFQNSSISALDNVKQIIKLNSSNKPNLKVIKGDLRDRILLEKVFEDENKSGLPIDGVIHFAGLKSVKESVKNPLLYWDANVISSINLLKVMQQNFCYKIVFSSSATIYGLCDYESINEDTEINPINPYGRTKSVVENLLNDIFCSFPDLWQIACLRYFNPIGAHDTGLIGENPSGIANNIFPLILDVASGKSKELKIYGNDWLTKDGTGIRDYIHVMDLAEGHIKALQSLFSGTTKILKLNLGTGSGTSVLELIETFSKVNNVSVPYKFSSRREGDVSRLVANNSKAKQILNWVPTRNLETMCLDGWKWKIKYPNGF